MVQVLPYVPTFLERISPAIGEIAGGIGQGYQKRSAVKAFEQARQQLRGVPKANTAVGEMEATAEQGTGLTPLQQITELYPMAEKAYGKDYADKLFRAGEAETKLEAREKIHQENLEFKENKLGLATTQDFREKVNAEHSNALANDLVYERMEALNKKDLAQPFTAYLSEHYGIPLSVLSNPDSEEFEKLSQTLSRGVTQAYRGRILASEFDSFLKQIPTLLNSKEGRQRVIDNLRYLDKPKELQFRAYRDIVKANRGRIPLDIEEQVLDKIEPDLKKLGKEFSKSLEAPKKQAAPEKGRLSVYDASGNVVGTVSENEIAQLPEGYTAK